MDLTTLAQVADWCGGVLLKGVPGTKVASVSTDSRTLKEGDLFLALKGGNFDGHKFVSDADALGVTCVIVSDLSDATESCSCAVIHVRDVLIALQNLASGYRRSLADVFVVGVTGSNGKTSTKDFLYSVLSRTGPVNATKGNLNNHIGLPLTILDTNSGHQSAIFEMGMNHPGEIEILAEIGRPDAAVITNIGSAHIEHMQTKEAIAREKASLPKSLSSAGYCAMPAEDAYFSYVQDTVDCRMRSVGLDGGDVTALDVSIGTNGCASFILTGSNDDARHKVDLPVRGTHMVVNALLAAAVGFEKGMPGDEIAEALSETVLTGGRLEEKTIKGVDFLDDSYNANPDSMRAALNVLTGASVEGKRVAVLGFMGELGEHEEGAHVAIGAEILSGGVDLLVTVGDRASLINSGAEGMAGMERNFEGHQEAAEFLADNLEEGDLVLIKGSRAAGMERIIEFLKQ